MARILLTLAMAAACVSSSAASEANPASACVSSCYRGLPVSLSNIPYTGRLKKRLDRDLYFVDRDELVWKADAGDITDGASIPTIFLRFTGPRFSPDFLPAAIIHDHYTDDRHLVREWPATAKVFYEAMIAHGTPRTKAKLMYYAVFVFGPHWADLKPGTDCGPRCVNLTVAAHTAGLYARTPSGEQRYREPEHATAADRAEIRKMKRLIASAETSRRPLQLADLRQEAYRRHPNNIFIARAVRR